MIDDVAEIMKEIRVDQSELEAKEPPKSEESTAVPENAVVQESEAVQENVVASENAAVLENAVVQESEAVHENVAASESAAVQENMVLPEIPEENKIPEVHKAQELSEKSGVFKGLEIRKAAEPTKVQEEPKVSEVKTDKDIAKAEQDEEEPVVPVVPKAPPKEVIWQRKGKVLTKEMIVKMDKRQARCKKIDKAIRLTLATIVAAIFAFLFLMPIVLTISNSFMGSAEIASNYGTVFATNANGGKVYISEKVNLKFIPDIVSFSQYITVLFKSPQYLLKFWNSVVLVGPIVLFQLIVATLASYGFARYTGKLRAIIFFAYVILMLMPYQVTLVPNYLVSDKLKILDTYWSIWLPGIFSPFAVYLLTKFMRRIPQSMIEAAQIDGAGEWQIYRRICLPLCKGAICSAAILVFIDYWNMVEQPLILLADGEKHPLSVFLSKINSGEVGLAFAVATIYMVPTLLVFLYGEEYLVDGITYQGGVKG